MTQNGGNVKQRTAALAVLALLLVGAPVGGADRGKPGIDADTAFQRIKALTGTWRGTEDAGRPITIEFKVGVRGTTVVETQSPGTDEEMVSVYSRARPDPPITHNYPSPPY